MKKTVVGILKKELTIDGNKITIEGKGWTSYVLNEENPSFFIEDIKSIEWKPKSTFTEKPNIYFNLTGKEIKKDMFGNSKDPYTFYFNNKDVDDMTEIYNYIMECKSNQGSSNSTQDDIPSQIKKLSDLKDSGILTEEEFESKKQELLKKM